jgi:hypothetical protein
MSVSKLHGWNLSSNYFSFGSVSLVRLYLFEFDACEGRQAPQRANVFAVCDGIVVAERAVLDQFRVTIHLDLHLGSAELFTPSFSLHHYTFAGDATSKAKEE